MKAKRLISSFLAVSLAVSLLNLPAMAAEYTDTEAHWANSAIERWSGYGVVQGNGGSFDPNGELTRGQLATILVNLLGLAEKPETNPYSDLKGDEWYADAILKCTAAGIMQGDGVSCNAEANISRQETTVMTARALGISPAADADLSGFQDGGEVADWAAGYVSAMASAGIITGTGSGAVAPGAKIDRASTVAILDKAISSYITEPGDYALDDAGIVLVRTSGAVKLTGEATGNVVVTPGAAKSTVSLDGVTVGGTLVIAASKAEIVATDSTLHGVAVTAPQSAVALEGKTTAQSMAVAEKAADTKVAVDQGAKLNAVTNEAQGLKVEGKGDVGKVDTKTDAVVSTPNTVTTKTETKVDDKGNTVTTKTETTNNAKGEAGTVKTETTTTKPDGSTTTDSKTETPNKPSTGGGGSSTTYYTVTFDTKGGSAVSAQSVASGSKAGRPAADPTKDGLTFCGWLLGGEPYDFDAAVTGSITLTARWGKDLAVSTTLGAAMAAALSDDTCDVFILPAGSYGEQIVLDGTGVDHAVTFLGGDAVTVAGPANYAALTAEDAICGEATTYSGLVVLKNFAQPVTLEGMTIQGDASKAAAADNVVHGSRYLLLALLDSSAILRGVTLTDVSYPDDLKGMQNGIGLYAVAASARTLTVRDSAVANFNKCGILTRANVGLTVTGTTITGYGTQAWIAQNGIQCAGNAAITGNTIKGLNYIAGNQWTNASCGVLDVGEGKTVAISDNSFENVDWPVNSEQATGGDAELGFQGAERVVAYNGAKVCLVSQDKGLSGFLAEAKSGESVSMVLGWVVDADAELVVPEGVKLIVPEGVKLIVLPGGKLIVNGILEVAGELEGKVTHAAGVGLTQATGYNWAAYSSGNWMALAVLVGDDVDLSKLESVRFELKKDDAVIASWTGDKSQVAAWLANYEQYWQPEGTPRWWEAYFPACDVSSEIGLVIADGKGTITDEESTIVVPADFCEAKYPVAGLSADITFETDADIYSATYVFPG